MGDSDIYSTTGPGAVSRRGFMKIGAAGTVGAVGLGAGGDHLDVGYTSDAEAIAPLVIAAGAGAVYLGGEALEWAFDEGYITMGVKEPSDGFSGDALRTHIRDGARKRLSNDRSTFVDQKNLIDAGLKNNAYAEGKLAAINAINNEKTEAAVETAALDAVDDYEETVITNFLKSWNASATETMNFGVAAEQHDNVANNFLKPWDSGMVAVETATWDKSNFYSSPNEGGSTADTRDYTFNNGNTFTVTVLKYQSKDIEWEENSSVYWRTHGLSPLMHSDDFTRTDNEWIRVGNGDVDYMHEAEWNTILTALEDAFQNARDGLALWVSNVYSKVQSGELDTGELMTPTEIAASSADEEEYNKAVADLMALNISVNLEREAEVYFEDTDSTVYGSIGVTGDTTLSTGTVDPSADDLSYYLTYDISQGEGVWNSYETGVDGGVVTFTSEPYTESDFVINTTAGETAQVSTSDFSEGDSTSAWTVDVSDQLETSITEVDSVEYFAQTSETEYQTVLLKDPFEIVTFTDSDGNEHDSAEHSSPAEPQDDTNYITKEEWEEQRTNMEDLIEEYNEDQNSGGAGGIIPDDLGGSTGMLLLVLAGGAAVLGLQGDN